MIVPNKYKGIFGIGVAKEKPKSPDEVETQLCGDFDGLAICDEPMHQPEMMVFAPPVFNIFCATKRCTRSSPSG